jgi:4-hydroxy-tetrahydrodipicolinate synthase
MGSSAVGARFGSVVTAMVTPFDEDGALDVDGAVSLARWLAAHGSDGLVLAGTTGEGSVLSDDEKLTLWEAVAAAVPVPVLAGTGSNDTAHSVALTKQAAATGVAGVLVVTPYYNRPSQEGLRRHFGAVASATTLPVMLYDIPVRSGRKIELATTLAILTEHRNVLAVKDASGDFVTAARLVAEAPPGFEVYSGDDAATLPLLALGAVGVVSVASHWIGPALGAVVSAFRGGRVDEARSRFAGLLDAMAFQTSDRHPNPLPAKAMCRALGLPAGECRLPMGPGGPDLDAAARQLAERLRRDGLLADAALTAAAGPGEHHRG